MAIELVLLKSGEELIADVREIIDRETNKPISVVLFKPVRVVVQQPGLLKEGTETSNEAMLSFSPWIATSKSEEFFVDHSWIVTVCEPNDDIKNSYIKNIGVNDDGESNLDEDGSVSDLGD
tara:strand:- start:244 stop:606 length:363 start_codon:yes stop_codon:yes gene_type:complete